MIMLSREDVRNIMQIPAIMLSDVDIRAQQQKKRHYHSFIKAYAADVLHIICGGPFFVLFWTSKKEHKNR